MRSKYGSGMADISWNIPKDIKLPRLRAIQDQYLATYYLNMCLGCGHEWRTLDPNPLCCVKCMMRTEIVTDPPTGTAQKNLT